MDEAILRTGAEALIPEDISKEIIQGAVANSAVLNLFKRLPNMASNKLRMSVLELLPMAYFVNGDTGFKKTTKMAWKNKYIVAEEIAVIVPIAEAVLDDARDNGYDIWGEVKPRVLEAFGKVIDGAVIFEENKPASWRDGVIKTAINAGNTVTETADFFNDVYGEDGVIAKVEKSGFIPNGVISSIGLRGKLRGLKDTTGRPLYLQDLKNGTSSYSIDGMTTHFLTNGVYDETKAKLITGDMSQGVYSIRQDITVKLLTEGVIQDPTTKEIVYNLAQQDMVALRFVMRLGWEIPNPTNALSPDATKRCPFAVYVKGAAEPTALNMEKSVSEMTKAELIAYANANNIEVDANANKDVILATIQAAE